MCVCAYKLTVMNGFCSSLLIFCGLHRQDVQLEACFLLFCFFFCKLLKTRLKLSLILDDAVIILKANVAITHGH